MTRLLHLEGRVLTAHAQVVGHAAGGFLLDKSLYHAARPGYHHAQPCDLGHVLAEGHKLKLSKVSWTPKGLVHRTEGPLPALGAKAVLHLDAQRRDRNARAHAAGHALVAAAHQLRATVLSPPTVVGGGEARLDVRFREEPRAGVAKLLAATQAIVLSREEIVCAYAPRDEAKVADQGLALDAILPGEPTLRLVRFAGAALPCDAPMPERASDIGALKLGLVQVRSDLVRVGVKGSTSR